VDEPALIIVTNVMGTHPFPAPFLVIYSVNRRLERTSTRRTVVHFYAGLVLCLINVFGVIATMTLPLWGVSVPSLMETAIDLALFAGSLLLCWFALLVKERQTGESPYKRLTDMALPFMLFFVFFIGILWGYTRIKICYGYSAGSLTLSAT
jgi:hypothetical protein